MIVITGSNGQLGTAFRRMQPAGARFLDRSVADLTRPGEVARIILDLEPEVVINCAAYTAVDKAETDEETADLVNHRAVEEMARTCHKTGARFVTYSTDYVFDGSKIAPYVESDRRQPVNAYGRTKAAGEIACLEGNPDALVIRTSWVISGTHPNFVRTMLDLGSAGRSLRVVDDQRGQATIADDLARATMAALERQMTGILHLSNPGPLTWYQLAFRAFELAGLDTELLSPCTTDEFPRPARRPVNSVLVSERLKPDDPLNLPPIELSLLRVVDELLKSPVRHQAGG